MLQLELKVIILGVIYLINFAILGKILKLNGPDDSGVYIDIGDL
jgi:hypothetical protein